MASRKMGSDNSRATAVDPGEIADLKLSAEIGEG